MPQPIAINLAQDGQTAEVVIRGFVGGWRTDLDHVDEQINALNVSRIVVRINTLGGYAHEGIAIHNVLKGHPATVEVIVEGVAGSAGSIIAMAADPGALAMYANALMMIHGAKAVDDWGDPVDTPEARAMVEAWNEALVETYVARTGQSADEIRAKLGTDTWMTAREAVAGGFADRVIELTAEQQAEARANAATIALATAAGVPADALDRANACAQASTEPETSQGGDPQPEAPAEDSQAGDPQPAADPESFDMEPVNEANAFAAVVMRALNQHNLAEFADAFLLDDTLAEPEAFAKALTHAVEVRALCNAVGAADHMPQLIRSHATPAEARKVIATARADASDALGINGHQPTAQPQKRKAAPNQPDPYARNRAAVRKAFPHLFQ